MLQKQKKKSYFNTEEFVEKVLQATGMNNADPLIVNELELEITGVLIQRISNTIIESFEEKELFMLKKMLEDHEEIDEIDAIVMIATTIPELNERLEKTVNDLYEELVQDYRDIDEAIKARHKKKP